MGFSILTSQRVARPARALLTASLCAALASCASGPSRQGNTAISAKPISGAAIALPDTVFFHQQDPRWARQTLGGSAEPLHSHGCLVTAAAMALTNLGFRTDPGDLTKRLKQKDGFTNRGWLVWQGLENVTGGKAQTRFYKTADESRIRGCMADGFYPLVKFDLPSRQPHWAVVIAEKEGHFYVRDPMVSARTPIPLKSRARGIDAVRCIGVKPS